MPDFDQRCQECEANFSSDHPFFLVSEAVESWGDINLNPSRAVVSVMTISALVGLTALFSSMLVAIPSSGPVSPAPIGILLATFVAAMVVSFASMGMAFLQPAARVGVKTVRSLIGECFWRRARRRFLSEYKA